MCFTRLKSVLWNLFLARSGTTLSRPGRVSVMMSYYCMSRCHRLKAWYYHILHAGASARTESELPAKIKPRSEVYK